MIFEVTIFDTKIWKTLIDIIANTIDNATFEADKTGLVVTAFDASRICLTSLTLTKKMFSAYKCPAPVKFTVTLMDFKKVFGRIAVTDEVHLVLNYDMNKLEVKTKRKHRNVARTLELALLGEEEELEAIDINAVNLDKGVKCDIEPAIFDEAVKDAKIYSDDLAFIYTNDVLTITTSSEVGEMRYEIGKDDLDSLEINTADLKDQGEITGRYALPYLEHIFKASAIASTVTMEYSNQNPIMFTFTIEGQTALQGIIDLGTLVFFLAPKVDQEHDNVESEEAVFNEADADATNYKEYDEDEIQ